MVVSLYRLHPQLTSMKDALRAAELAGLEGRVVLDPFAGTGTLVYSALRAGAKFVIGSDIEDWENYLRPQLRGVDDYIMHWHLDAMDAVKYYSHEVLFTDPPNPTRVVGSAPISLVRDFHISGSELRRMFSFDERNLMGKKWVAVTYVVRLIRYELKQGRRAIIHAFSSGNFDWREILSRHFKLERIYADYFEIGGR